MSQAEGGYVGSIQMLSRDKLKYHLNQQFCHATNLFLSCDITFTSRQKLHYIITVKHRDIAKDAFSA